MPDLVKVVGSYFIDDFVPLLLPYALKIAEILRFVDLSDTIDDLGK